MNTNSIDKSRYEEYRKKVNKYLEENLVEKKRRHTIGVMQTARDLADIYGEDPERAELAALCHDMCKSWDDEKMNAYVKEKGLPEKYLNARNLSHSKAAALMAREEMGIDDEEVLNAICYHTTGRAHMSILERIIYLADAIEPFRKGYPGIDEVREMAYNDLEKAYLMSLENTRDYLLEKGIKEIDNDTLEAIEWLKEEIGE